MKIKDCYQCFYNHWGLGIGVGVAACTRFLKALRQVFCRQAASPGKNTFRRHGLSLPITNVPFSVAAFACSMLVVGGTHARQAI